MQSTMKPVSSFILRVHLRVESFICMLNWCQDFFFIITQLIYHNYKYEMTDLRGWITIWYIDTPSLEEIYACSS